MSYTNGLDKPTDYFDTTLYTGNGSSQTLTMDNVGLLWMKRRDSAIRHCLFDSVRGGHYTGSGNPPLLVSDSTAGAQGTDIDSAAKGITFGATQTVIGNDSAGYSYNVSGHSMVGWQWSGGGSAVSNTDGSITSSVSANTTSGFSIVSYTGNGSAGATIGHGLGGVVPNVIIAKKLNNTSNWSVYHSGIGNFAKTLSLNTTSGTTTDSGVWDNVPTSSTFLVGSDNTTNANGDNYIAYCFAEKKGYSKFGSYKGNGSTDGTFIYTGFKPAFYLWKRIDSAGEWFIVDNKRDTENITEVSLKPNTSEAESVGNGYNGVDFLSNGVKVRQANSDINNSSGTYIYMAFSESPFVTSGGIPTTAR